jgi:hypothetical protein
MEMTEKQLEEKLKQLPKIRDNRDSHELYRAISIKLQKKKRPGWIFPSIATVAASALLFLLIPNFFNWESQSNKESENKSSMEFANKESDSNADSISLKREDATKANDSANENMMMDSAVKKELGRTAIYQEDLPGNEILTYAIPDANGQNIVPISILVSKNESKSWDEQFLETMPMFSESDSGLSEYFPLNGTLTFNLGKKKVNLDVPINHQYGKGSASETNFLAALQMTFRYTDKIEVITFTTDGKPGIELGNNELQQLDLAANKQLAYPYYLLYAGDQNRPLLVPFNNHVKSIDEALEVMQEGISTHGLQASIPSKLGFEKIDKTKGTLTIYFSKDAQIESTEEMIYGIEAILLTAKEFGFNEVEFKNSEVTNIGPFDLKQPLAVPVAPNKREVLQ